MYLDIVFVAVVLFYSIHISLSFDPHWNYRELGPDVWKDFYPTCGSTAQSPINIKTQCTTYQSYLPFQFSSAYNLTQYFLLKNNGHTIVAEQMNKTAFPLILSGGGLNEAFTFKNFHLHWGENYNSGSEHQL
jgi:carbonic anhydrase